MPPWVFTPLQWPPVAHLDAGMAADGQYVWQFGGVNWQMNGDDAVRRYDMAADSWSVVNGLILPITGRMSSVRVGVNLVWLSSHTGPAAIHVFDMTSSTIRADITVTSPPALSEISKRNQLLIPTLLGI